MSSYQLVFRDGFGTVLYITEKEFSLALMRKEMEVGYFEVELPFEEPLLGIIQRDTRVDIMRSTSGLPYYLEGDTTWFIRDIAKTENANGKFLKISGEDAIGLLNRRTVPYLKTSPEAFFEQPCDNALKHLVRLNLGALCTDVLRRLNPALFTVQADFSILPNNTFDCAFMNVLDELKDNCYQSLYPATGVNPRYLTFDVVCATPIQLEFRAYIDQRGASRILAPSLLTFSIANGNLSSITVEEDATEEFNVVFAGGAGENQNRLVIAVDDVPRRDFGPFTRIERFLDGQDADTADSLAEQARTKMVEGRIRYIMEGEIQENENCRYGVHYNFGDLVMVEGFGSTTECHLDTIEITYKEGRETIKPVLHGDWYV